MFDRIINIPLNMSNTCNKLIQDSGIWVKLYRVVYWSCEIECDNTKSLNVSKCHLKH